MQSTFKKHLTHLKYQNLNSLELRNTWRAVQMDRDDIMETDFKWKWLRSYAKIWHKACRHLMLDPTARHSVSLACSLNEMNRVQAFSLKTLIASRASKTYLLSIHTHTFSNHLFQKVTECISSRRKVWSKGVSDNVHWSNKHFEAHFSLPF